MNTYDMRVPVKDNFLTITKSTNKGGEVRGRIKGSQVYIGDQIVLNTMAILITRVHYPTGDHLGTFEAEWVPSKYPGTR